MARLSRLTQPPRRAGTMAFMLKLWHRRTEHHNNGYDNGHFWQWHYAYNSSAGTSLTINAATTTGATDGIDAYNIGSGALSITTTGTTTGTIGINAQNGYIIMAPSMARLSRLTQPPRRAGIMVFLLITPAPAH